MLERCVLGAAKWGRRLVLLIGLVSIGMAALGAGVAHAASYGEVEGEVPFYQFEDQRLDDRLQLRVNVVSGDLLAHLNDLHVAGTGQDLSVDHYYNSLATSSTGSGYGWKLNWGAGRLGDGQRGRVGEVLGAVGV